jgi:hypothetical protein
MPPKFRLWRLAALAGATALAGAASAQTDNVYRTVEAAPGKLARLGAHISVKPDCSAGTLPEIKVLTPPKSGTLNVRTGKVRTTRITRCPNLETPAQGIFYIPNPRFSGSDEVVYEVRSPEGRVRSHTIRITVSDKPSPAPKKPDEATDL